ncbi:hypothetical protein [Aestuariimicrobium ganziense]|uniref:hypothetical protein n=1 Tax=Aestuariimicrobium ganziense TaxID=2773677 RepID=UPI0019429EDF|nr:hypothetical protein [Aestuariimicrobium ganziense]
MAWIWSAEPGPGTEVTAEDLEAAGIGTRFDDQAAAEAWLATDWEVLADLGVTEVSLFEEDRLVYGPMSLLAE